MKYLTMIGQWLLKHAVALVIGLCTFLYLWAAAEKNTLAANIESEKFQCQTACFPNQHEYLQYGNANACWCYIDKDNLRRLKN